MTVKGWSRLWGSQFGKQHCFQIPVLNWFTGLTPTSLITTPHHHWPSLPQAISEKAKLYSYHLYTQAVQVIFCQVPVGLRDSRGGICNTLLFLDQMFWFCSSSFSLALGESSAFSLMLSYQLNTLSPKGCVGVLLNDLGNRLCWLNRMANDELSEHLLQLGCMDRC